jgi:ketosteroid isomerase-like protein
MLRSLLPIALFLLPGAVAAFAQTPGNDIVSTIIAMERAALDRSDKGDASEFLRISDPDVVYIDPSLDKPIYGLTALAAYYAKFPAGDPANHGEMLNSKVQVSGDTAVLTFNYKSKGKPSHGWNATEVYRRTGKNWLIIHTHWSYVKPPQP